MEQLASGQQLRVIWEQQLRFPFWNQFPFNHLAGRVMQ